jgi:uncharacterized protein with LGFP repeats
MEQVELARPARAPVAIDTPIRSGRRTTRPFRLVGVTWSDRAGLEPPQVQVRVRTDGRWSAWQVLEPLDAGPDAGTAEAERSPRVGTEPLWTDTADGVDVVVTSGPRGRVVDARVELVDPGRSPADETLGRPRVLGGAGAVASALSSQPPIIGRAGWGADESLRLRACPSGPSMARTVRVGFVHHTVTRNDYGPAEVPAIIRSIYAYHVNANGWCDVGYNFLVDRFGRIFEGRYGGAAWAVIGGHTGGFNTESFGVAMIGTYTSSGPPSATWASVQRVLAWKLGNSYRDPRGRATLQSRCPANCRYPPGTWVSFNAVSGHRDATLTACPGNVAYGSIPAVRNAVVGLVGSFRTVVWQKWQQLGGEAGRLGPPNVVEHDVPGGRATRFVGGAIYWSPATPASAVYGTMLDRYVLFGGPASPLGYPISDEARAPGGGRFNFFQRGAIFWRADLGAFEVHGTIYQRWSALRREVGLLGYPVANEQAMAGGAMSRFEHGRIYSSAASGAHEVHGPILDRYLADGGPAGALGFPTTDQYAVEGGARSDFQRGSIVWDEATATTSVIPPGSGGPPPSTQPPPADPPPRPGSGEGGGRPPGVPRVPSVP